MTAVAILGVTGRMGRALLATAPQEPGVRVSGAWTRSGNAATGIRAGQLVGREGGPVVTATLHDALRAADVAIDFTLPTATIDVVQACDQAGCALVCGTTGLDAAAMDALGALARAVPVLQAANMSVGVTLALHLATTAAATLDDSYDVEIVEAHHRHKRDAPSGTALALGNAVASARGRQLRDVAVYDRHGAAAPRKTGEIGIASVRAGDIVGDHRLMFAADGETIEIRHRATSREIFAAGAWRAALWLAGRAPGAYDMRDVLGLDRPPA